MPRTLLLIFLIISGQLQANDSLARLDSLELVGEGKYSYMFWNIYDIALLSPDGSYSEEPPFALRIGYSRNFSGSSIADQSSKLIRKQGFEDEIRLAGWHMQMDEIFPNVSEGSILTGLFTVNKETIFYESGEELGRIRDPLFGKYFFGIWLGEQTTAPALREQLIGAFGD